MANHSVLTQIPENTNFVQGTKFTFSIPSLPHVNYFCQTVNIPGISTSAPQVPTPFSDTFRHGDKLVFDQLSITFLVDEDLRVWEELYQWLAVLTNPVKFKEYQPKFKDKYYDGILNVNTNSNTPNIRFKFKYMHPVSVGSIQFDVTTTAAMTPICDVTFQYDRLEIERLR